jgi:hypothetical protein
LVEQLRAIPNNYRTWRAIQFTEDGREIGHQSIPVGYMMHEAANKIESLQQQLLATQEAYQRVVEALQHWGVHAQDCKKSGWDFEKECTCGLDETLANPPSLENVERKKLEDEIAVLEESIAVSDRVLYSHILNLIAERKAKLEKMK